MKLRILFLLGMLHTFCYGQIKEIGILKSNYKQYSISANDKFIEMNFSDKNYIHFKFFDSINQIKKEGFLNRKKFNLDKYSLNEDTLILSKGTETGVGVLTDGYIYFNPKLKFKDTSDLLDYVYEHLLHDSIELKYDKNGNDTVKFKIYVSSCTGQFYSQSTGKYKSARDKTSYFINATNDLGDEIFMDDNLLIKSNKQLSEDIIIYRKCQGILAHFYYVIGEENRIKSADLLIDNERWRFENHKLVKME